MNLKEILEKKHASFQDINNFICEMIDAEIADEKIKKTLLGFYYETNSSYDFLRTSYIKMMHIRVWQMMVTLFSKITVGDISWQLICKCYHIKTAELLNCSVNGKELLKSGWLRERGVFRFFDCIIQYYTYLSNTKLFYEKNILEISNYKVLFMARQYNDASVHKQDKSKNDEISKFVSENISTNFPINTSYTHIVSYTMLSETGKKVYFNYNVNTDNCFIKDILYKYISTFDDIGGVRQTAFRIFLFYFVDSLPSDEKFHKIEQFTIEVFKSQYSYYKSLQLKYSSYMSNKGRNLEYAIVNFYRFLAYLLKDIDTEKTISNDKVSITFS